MNFRALFAQFVSSFMAQAPVTTVDESNDPADTVNLGSDEEPGPTQLVRMEPFGDVCIPPRNTRCATFRHNGGGYCLPLGEPKYRPKDGKPGTRGLYCSQPGTEIWLRGDRESAAGQLEIKSATGKDVVVNGGTKKVARVDDAVGYLVITYAPIPPGGTVAVTVVAWSATIPGGAVTPPVPGTPGVYYQPITITGGALHFKA